MQQPIFQAYARCLYKHSAMVTLQFRYFRHEPFSKPTTLPIRMNHQSVDTFYAFTIIYRHDNDGTETYL